MSFKLFAIASLALSTLVSASPIESSPETSLSKRFNVLSGQWDTESENGGYYTLYNNLWGMSAATSGSQSTQATSVNGKKVAWKTTYTWAGGPYNVKSYANLGLNSGLGKQLSAISSITTGWYWTYTSASSGLVANVAYDLWLSTSASGSSTDEIMIWLSTRGGAGPAGSQITTASVNGVSWKLFKGTVSTWTVWSFVAPSELTGFNSDLKPFFTYLINSQGLSSSKYLTGVQAGTEPFVGSATLTTTEYSVTVN
ncbi:Xyloglucan-specific endo-beta-1,4-glucanase A [Ceratobasidium theobromae]|uniref:Xyloglucan-specific endo-beta-1,4-glucanase A n=1 Tax=Ceratobasidium theobromae TaxID=1582974 RepID=A0A5N5QAQ0_9AGAM|nr:Xyloglucan-specific endo-beta-1,4-glucanase A [Ceratobasidium theobromae]